MIQSEPAGIIVNLDYLADAETSMTLFEVVREVEEDGENFDEVYYKDSYYVTADLNNDFYFVISSEDIQDSKAVRLDITDLNDLTSDDETHTASIPLILNGSGNDNGSDDNISNDREEFISGVGSSGSGCNAGFTFCAATLLSVILFLFSASKSKACYV